MSRLADAQEWALQRLAEALQPYLEPGTSPINCTVVSNGSGPGIKIDGDGIHLPRGSTLRGNG